MNTFLSLISFGVLISILLSAWAVFELNSMKTDIVVINKDVANVLGQMKEIKSQPVRGARPNAPPSQPQNVLVSIDDDPIKGDPNAPVTIIEFSDYQCPFCKRFYDNTLGQIDEEYISKGKVRLVFRDYPLGFHKKAMPAAIAANCAGEQGKYWEVHDFFFENPTKLDVDSVLNSSKELNLNEDQFRKCAEDKTKEAEVNKDFEAGQKYGVRGTPSFFIGKTDNGKKEMTGVYVRGAQPFSAFKTHIDKLLAEKN
ncbi:DsbA family protein [Desulfobacterota bacterium AH_259_B03_O07]|nr:DsbA family protein [Desulfobacterota bacterium AH_259_B03_O07]